MRNIPSFEEKTKEELDEIIRIINASSLSEPIKTFIMRCIDSALWFPQILQKKDISLHRLRTMLFGNSYKSKKSQDDENKNLSNDQVVPKNKENPNEISPENFETNSAIDILTTKSIEAFVNQTSTDVLPKEKGGKPGHGRMAHTVYESFKEFILKIVDFKAGDPCPKDCGGTLYPFNPEAPRVLVRIKGQNFADVYKYIIEQLRCNLCQYLLQAEIPVEIGTEKYDASFKAWIVIQKYFVAVPFYRQATFQNMLNFPLSDATQWDLVEQVAGFGYCIFNLLTTFAANGKLIHNDDTRVKILEVIKEIKQNPDAGRTGMFTTGMMAEHEGHKIALFFNGTSHSGENMEIVLKKRAIEKPPIIQMCDALACNLSKEIKTILCNCLSHGFRKFKELENYFPTACITVMKLLSQVYENDELTKEMSPDKRLEHHQTHSAPVMDMLSSYLKALFDEKQVEPNSELGKAIKYMNNHWHKLTRFLSVPGAPLCNNILERALKIAIRNRKNAMFYRTRYSAHIGGMLTSIIYTCYLNKQNPHHYLTTLQNYPTEINKNPQAWLPWNYKETLNQFQSATASNVQEYVHVRDGPVAI